MDLKKINPKNGDKYSPNLFKFLKALSPLRRESIQVFKRSESKLFCGDGLWIGTLDGKPGDQWLHGCRLNSALCFGVKAARREMFAHPIRSNENFELLENFWSEYERIGRCAIDSEHTQQFIGGHGRWASTATHRHCLWCGEVVQEKTTFIKTEVRDVWTTIPAVGKAE